MLTKESRAEIARLKREYPDPQSALLGALLLAQKDYGGWLPDRAFDEVAAVMELPPTLVASVATFYTMLYRRPVGRHVIHVCTNISCSLLGAEDLVEYVSRKLGVSPGETTPDGRITLLEVECLGLCGTAPALQLGDRVYDNLTEEKVDQILAGLT